MRSDAVSDAVRNLRKALNDSQQAFAQRTKNAVRTIARYETVRPPRGAALAQMAVLARENGQDSIAEIFEDRLSAELGSALSLLVDKRLTVQELYTNRGDSWLFDEIREFLRMARRGAPIIHPVRTLPDGTLDREAQLHYWEHELVTKRMQPKESFQRIGEDFARDYARDMDVDESVALTYARERFPFLWKIPNREQAGQARGIELVPHSFKHADSPE